MPTSPAGPDPDRDIQLDTATLRVLAHPVRINVLTLLRQRGPSTATRLATALDINPGAASYHLRRLAAGGLITDEPDLGTGRDRWWKAVHRQSIHDPAADAPDQREAGRAYSQAVALASSDRLRAAAADIPLLPQEWLEASSYADFVLRLAPDEVDRLRAELFDVVGRYRERQTAEPGSAAPVSLQLQAFPVPGSLDPAPDQP